MFRGILTTAGVLWIFVALGMISDNSQATPSVAWTIEDGAKVRSLSQPSQTKHLPKELVHHLRVNHSALAQRSLIQFPLPSGQVLDTKVHWKIGQQGTRILEAHGISDFRSKSSSKAGGYAQMTVSDHGLFGELYAPEGRFMINTDAQGTWMVKLDDHRIDLGHQCGLDHTDGSSMMLNVERLARQAQSSSPALPQDGSMVYIDVAILYLEDMMERYPGPLLNERFAHYFNVANQVLANSEIDGVMVRLVDTLQASFEPNPSSTRQAFDLIAELETALNITDPNGSPETSISAYRRSVGADILSIFLTADIEKRGVCGLARFPEGPNSGINFNSDGISNWSVCEDSVFIHELGHNLGAYHQASTMRDAAPPESQYAWVKSGLFTTLMRSFSSNDLNRYLALPIFSSPTLRCAGEACGLASSDTVIGADNRTAFLQNIATVTAYESAVSSETLTPLAKAQPDHDGDGVVSWEDTTPFGEFQGPVEGTWVAPRQLAGTGREDYDLLISSSDDTIRGWRLNVSSGARSLGVVINAEPPAFPDLRPALNEFSSVAVRNDGLLFTLSGGAVKTYSRLSGEEISTFRGPTYSRDSDQVLAYGFPRAAEISGDGRVLAVLGQTLTLPSGVLAYFMMLDPDDGTVVGPEYFVGGGIISQHGPFELGNWRDVALSDDGSLMAMVSDFPEPQLNVYDVLPNLSATYKGTRGIDDVVSPRALAMKKNQSDQWVFYVLDEATNKIWSRLDSDALVDFPVVFIDGAQFVNQLTIEAEPMTRIRDFALGPDGYFYVLDQGSRAVLRFDDQGGFDGYVIGPGAPELEFSERMTFAPGLLGDSIFEDQFQRN